MIATTALWTFVNVTSAYTAVRIDIPQYEEPHALPKVAFEDTAGRAVALETWQGKVVVLNFWATYCAPCRAEMPSLDHLQARLGSERFEVVALSVDHVDADSVRRFLKHLGVRHLETFFDDGMEVAKAFGVIGLPTTLLIDPGGYELGRLVGPAEWDRPEMVDFFEGIIRMYETAH